MKRLRPLFIVSVFAITCFGFLQQSSEVSLYYKEYLGFSLMPGANSTAVTFHIIRKWDDPKKPIEGTNISQAEFMSIAGGFQSSNANPEGKNLFAEHGLINCGFFNDTVINHMLYNGGMRCNPVNDLWRLRYAEWPFYVAAPRKINQANTLDPQGPGPGWARKPLMPSEGQLEILKGYGPITDPMVDVIWGDDAFRLLKDMQDAGWVATYRGS